jgi:hypothetical protein
MDRRLFIASAFACPLLVGARTDGAPDSDAPKEGIFVPAGMDRDKEVLKVVGVIPLQIKVATKDTGGSLFVLEHAGMGKGGPPRHVHFEQDEWFYATQGSSRSRSATRSSG